MADAHSPPTERPGDSKGRFLTFWTTLPGVLTGLAALLTAVVGLATLWHSGDKQDGASTPGGATATSQAGTETSGKTATPAGVLHTGRVSLNNGDSLDLERGVIGPAGGDVGFGPESTPTLHASASAFLAPIDGAAGKTACTAALSSRHDGTEIIPNLTSDTVCVSTAEGHVGFVKVVAAPGVGNANLTLDYTVWL